MTVQYHLLRQRTIDETADVFIALLSDVEIQPSGSEPIGPVAIQLTKGYIRAKSEADLVSKLSPDDEYVLLWGENERYDFSISHLSDAVVNVGGTYIITTI